MVRELTGVDDDFRQGLRDAVLATTAADFRDFGERLQGLAETGRVVVLGSKEAIESANAERGGSWLEVVPVL
jgi:Zn-dependent M16 (insulinase) family peptidase